MARFETEVDKGRLRVSGLYEALRVREREHQRGHDRFAGQYPQYRGTRDRRLLDALEAGKPVVLEGRRLRGWGIPRVPLCREQAFQLFRVTSGDIVTAVRGEVE